MCPVHGAALDMFHNVIYFSWRGEETIKEKGEERRGGKDKEKNEREEFGEKGRCKEMKK